MIKCTFPQKLVARLRSSGAKVTVGFCREALRAG